jgi:hypothetical protein
VTWRRFADAYTDHFQFLLWINASYILRNYLEVEIWGFDNKSLGP